MVANGRRHSRLLVVLEVGWYSSTSLHQQIELNLVVDEFGDSRDARLGKWSCIFGNG